MVAAGGVAEPLHPAPAQPVRAAVAVHRRCRPRVAHAAGGASGAPGTGPARAGAGSLAFDPETTAKNTDRLIHLANQLLSLARHRKRRPGHCRGWRRAYRPERPGGNWAWRWRCWPMRGGASLALEAPGRCGSRVNRRCQRIAQQPAGQRAGAIPQGGNVIPSAGGGVLEVEDDGPGNSRRRPRAGLPAASTAWRYPGSGLGLAIVGECRRPAEIQLDQANCAACWCGCASGGVGRGLLQHAGGGFRALERSRLPSCRRSARGRVWRTPGSDSSPGGYRDARCQGSSQRVATWTRSV